MCYNACNSKLRGNQNEKSCRQPCAFVLAYACFSNDTLVQKNTGGNDYIIGDAKDIIIESEILQIDLFDDYYHVFVDYVFRNEGAEAVLEVGFPEIEYQSDDDYIKTRVIQNDVQHKLFNFKTSVNGINQNIDFADADIIIDAVSPKIYEKIMHFYKKQSHFLQSRKLIFMLNTIILT